MVNQTPINIILFIIIPYSNFREQKKRENEKEEG